MDDVLDAPEPSPLSGPSAGDPVIVCPRCKVPAHQIWQAVLVGTRDTATRFYDEAKADQRTMNGINGPIHVGVEWSAAHCQACDQRTLWRGNVNVYPVSSAAPAPHPLMDPDVRELFDEAGRVLPLSRRAGAALVRAALERQVKLLTPDAPSSKRLDDRIAILSHRVSKPLGELLDVVRHLGNASLHGSEDDELVYLYLSDSEGADDIAELLFVAINDLVDELVARPESTKFFWNKLPENVQESIRRKRQAIEG